MTHPGNITFDELNELVCLVRSVGAGIRSPEELPVAQIVALIRTGWTLTNSEKAP